MSTTIEAPPVAPPQAPPSVDPRDLLLRAAAIVRRGWCQNAIAVTIDGMLADYWTDGASAFCGAGAVRRAVWETTGMRHLEPGGRRVTALRNKLQRRIDVAVGEHHFCSLPNFNDHPGRTAEEVAELLERAAAL